MPEGNNEKAGLSAADKGQKPQTSRYAVKEAGPDIAGMGLIGAFLMRAFGLDEAIFGSEINDLYKGAGNKFFSILSKANHGMGNVLESLFSGIPGMSKAEAGSAADFAETTVGVGIDSAYMAAPMLDLFAKTIGMLPESLFGFFKEGWEASVLQDGDQVFNKHPEMNPTGTDQQLVSSAAQFGIQEPQSNNWDNVHEFAPDTKGEPKKTPIAAIKGGQSSFDRDTNKVTPIHQGPSSSVA